MPTQHEPLKGLARVGVVQREDPNAVVDDAGTFLRDLPHPWILGQDAPAASSGLGQEGDVLQRLSCGVAVVIPQRYTVQAVQLADFLRHLMRKAAVDQKDLVALTRPWPPTPGVHQLRPPPAALACTAA